MHIYQALSWPVRIRQKQGSAVTGVSIENVSLYSVTISKEKKYT